jgi:hypothetical protein
MADLTPLDEELGEMLGPAQAGELCDWEIVGEMAPRSAIGPRRISPGGRFRCSVGTSKSCAAPTSMWRGLLGRA